MSVENPFVGRETSFWRPEPPKAVAERPLALSGTVWSPAVLSRNDVRYLRCRAWGASAKDVDLQRFKQVKVDLDDTIVSGMVDDMVALVQPFFGAGMFAAIVPVACGHSRRPNCLAAVLAAQIADRLEQPLLRAFEDRFVSGVSHPKEFSKLPPLVIQSMPPGACLVVDDVATSGFHMHEAVTALRSAGVAAMGVVWISGVRQS